MIRLLLLGLVGLKSFIHPYQVWAQSPSPSSEQVQVTATITSDAPPTAPILISPENNSYATTGLVTFIWQASTDSQGIGYYKLSLNGSTYFNYIPTTDTDNSQYTLSYDSSTTYYTLTVKTALSDGSYTWKITAVDNYGSSTDSATWNFTVDTQSPSFIITQIGDQTVSISAQDLGTVPTNPIELENNEPLLSGTGEANSQVVLTVAIPDDPTQTHTFAVSGSGTWEHRLGILPRGEVITLDFVITDPAGNISSLPGVKILIKEIVIIIPPPTPSPTPGPSATPSPTPTSVPTPTPGVTPQPSPLPSPSPPLITIPFTPPREIAHEVIQETIERLPAPVQELIAAIPPEVQQRIVDTARTLAPTSAVMVVAALPLLTTAVVATQFGAQFSLHLLFRVLQAIGLIPTGKPQGLVYDSKTHQGIAFALITITRLTDEAADGVTDKAVGKADKVAESTSVKSQAAAVVVTTRSLPMIETVVTNPEGVYSGIKLPPGKYQLTVAHQDYSFPTQEPRPAYFSSRDFYRGETFEIKSNQDDEVLFLIPMDRIVHQPGEKSNFKNRLKVLLARISRFNSVLVLPLFIITGMLTILFPTIWNWSVFGLYLLIVAFKASQWFKIPTISGQVVDRQGTPLENVIVRLVDPQSNQAHTITTTKKNGSFSTTVPKGEYQLHLLKPGFVWTENGPATSLYLVDASNEPKHVVASLEQL